MNHIIEVINNKLLNKWGFEYKDMYWVHNNYEFRLQKKDDYYIAFLKTIDGYKPQNIKTNGQLLMLITSNFSIYLTRELQSVNLINTNARTKFINDKIKEYFSFDKNLEFYISQGPMGIGLSPNNEYTYTMISNIECIFKVTTVDKNGDDKVNDDIYYNPSCISLEFLKSLYPDELIKNVIVMTADDSWEQFFGVGIPKAVIE